MMSFRRLITAIFMAVFVSSGVCADMMSSPHLNDQRNTLSPLSSQTQGRQVPSFDLYDNLYFSASDLWYTHIPVETGADISQIPERTQSIDFSNGPDSRSLSLYALMSLGLLSAPGWMGKLFNGHIHERHHSWELLSISHSKAVSLDYLCPMPVHCFVQTDYITEKFIPQYRMRTIVSSWRKSQLTPDGTAPRGPPLC